ncbi:MAG TPA: serine hydrolase domain-containing protein [Iamia sp.]
MSVHRRVLLLVATLLVLVAAACTQDTEDPPRSGDDEEGAPADLACDPEVDEALRAWAEAGFSGTVALSTGGRLDCEAAYGQADQEEGRPNTLDTVFAIGSVSKAFAAAAVLDLVAAGELTLDDRAGDLLPTLGGPAADATVGQLLLHTSGLTGEIGADREPLSEEEAITALGGLEQAAEPGTEFLYSNAGYALLALIVQEVSGTPYRDHIRADVLTVDGDVLGGFWDGDPAAAGPRAVGYDDAGDRIELDDFAGPYWATAGNGDLAMTTTELARWTHALFAGEVIAPEAVELLETTAFDEGDGREEVPGWVRFDAEQLGEPAYAVAGGGGDLGHEAVTAWLPESERVVSISTNTADVLAEDLLAELAPALIAGDPLPVPDEAAEADPDEVAAAEGTYELDGGDHLVVTATDDGLAIAAEGAAATAALFPPADEADAAARADHEELVRALLAGETRTGEEEVAALEEDLGPIESVEIVGTIDTGELRTYARLEAGGEEALVWYAVDDRGGIAAVEITDDPPTLVVVPAGSGTYRPADPTGSGPEVVVGVGDDQITVTGPDGAVTARRAG